MSRLASARWSATDDALGARAVDFDEDAVGGLAVDEGGAHHAGQLELAADDADVAAPRPARAHHGSQVLVEGGKEGGSRVAHQGHDPLGALVEQGKDVVGSV